MEKTHTWRQVPDVPMQGKVQLQNPQLERALLNSLLSHRDGTDDALTHLTDDYFYEAQHRMIFQAIREVYNSGQEVSWISVYEYLNAQNGDYWSQQRLVDIINIAQDPEEPMSMHSQVHTLAQYAIRRALGPVAMQLLTLSTCLTTDLSWGLQQVELGIQRALGCEVGSNFVTMHELLDEARRVANENLDPATQHSGLLTGLPQFDKEGGLPRGSLVVIGGKSSHGKTSFANYLALQTMLYGGRVAYFSMEMSNLELVQRFLSMESRVRSNAIAHLPLYEGPYRSVMAAADRLDAWGAERFYFDRKMHGDFDHMVQQIRSLHRMAGLDLVVVDYLQLLNLGPEQRGTSRASLLASASHRMKDLCRETGVTILALSQVNRDCVGIPTSENFLDSSAIKQAADLTYIIYCAEAEGPKGLDSYPAPFQEYPVKDTALVIQDKGRTMGRMSFLVGFERQLTRIYPIAEVEAVDGGVGGNEQLEIEF